MTSETIKAVAEAVHETAFGVKSGVNPIDMVYAKATSRAFLQSEVMREVRDALEEIKTDSFYYLTRQRNPVAAYNLIGQNKEIAVKALAKLAELEKELGE